MTISENPAQDFPLLTGVVPDAADDLPVLTDIAAEPSPSPVLPPAAANPPSELAQAIETYLETVLTEKLKAHLAIAQQWAVDAAVAELKSELPALIRSAQEHADTNR